MQMQIDIPEERIKSFIQEVMQSYPEASSPSLQCVPHEDGAWGYDECRFLFWDVEEDQYDPRSKCRGWVTDDGRAIYEATYDDLRRGFEILIGLVAAGKLKGLTFDLSYLHRTGEWDDWAGDWDADVLDALVQCAIFGDVIYG